jgi:hypothetical protein
MQLLNNRCLFHIGERKLVVTGHDACQALNIATVKRHDVDSVYRLTSFSTPRIATAAAVAFNNPDTTFITGDNFQWRNGTTIHQVVKQVIISLAGAIIVFTLIEAFTHMDIGQSDEHPGIGTLNAPITGHLFE